MIFLNTHFRLDDEIHSHFREEEVPLSINTSLNKMVYKIFVALPFHLLKDVMMVFIFTH